MAVYYHMNELYHHGVKGQKWGVRRYQNPDGTLTPEGKRKYYNDDGSQTRAGVVALNNHKINFHDNREMQKKFHDSKEKKENEFSNSEYLLTSSKASKGEQYIKQLEKELVDRKVTSFIEDSKGNTNVKGKTSKGVVIRDANGNRVTAYDYDQAQKMIHKYRHYRINTGMYS